MNSDFAKMILGSLLRTIAASIGGYVVNSGIGDAAMGKEVGGAFIILATFAWSWWQKYGHVLVARAFTSLQEKSNPVNVQAAKIDARSGTVEAFKPAAIKIIAPLVLVLMLLNPHHATAAPATPCNLLTLFVGLSPTNFNSRLSACSSADFKAALEDAQTEPVDHIAIACLQPAMTVIAALETLAQGTSGPITALQKFRRAKQTGVIGSCLAYGNTTALLQ